MFWIWSIGLDWIGLDWIGSDRINDTDTVKGGSKMYLFSWLFVGVAVWFWMSYRSKGRSNRGFGGWWATLIAAIAGAGLGDWILGDWVWVLAGYNVIAGAVGALTLYWLWMAAKSKV
jgi:uncharacterized membrane protein YeaQ/YmgE (transglycosylase-associated protein family)